METGSAWDPGPQGIPGMPLTGLGRGINKNEPCASLLQYLQGVAKSKSSCSPASLCTHSLSSAVGTVGLESLPKSGGILARESKPWRVRAAEQSPIPRRDLLVPLGPQRLRLCERGWGSARSSSCRPWYHGNWQGSGCESTGSRVPQKCFPYTHTHISSQCSGRNLSPRRFLVSSFPLSLIHW